MTPTPWSRKTLRYFCSINDNGGITGLGVTTAVEFHAYLLTPIRWPANPSEGSE